MCCSCRCNCTLAAIVASVVLGVVAAFLQIAGVFTATVVFAWVALGVAVVYLGLVLLSTALARADGSACKCAALNALLVGILGTALVSLVLLAVGIVATSVVSALLVGLLVAFLALILASTACLVRNLADCGA